MRLEFENNASTAHVNGSVNHQSDQEKFTEYLNAGVRAAQTGDRKSARRYLMSALDIDAQSENAWLWLASISEYPEELLVFLNNVLDINPRNERALQWSASTKLLLSKTLVQRGIDANENGRRDFAIQCFDQALTYDMQNVSAWLWLASLAETEERKLEYFRRVLDFEPENEVARTAVEAAEKGTRDSLFQRAAFCAVNGDTMGAEEFLSKILERWSDDLDSWLLRSLLAQSLSERVQILEHIRELNAENQYATSTLALIDRFKEVSSNVTETVDESYSASEPEPVDTIAVDAFEAPIETPAEFRFDSYHSNGSDPEMAYDGASTNDAYLADEFPTVDAFSVSDDILDAFPAASINEEQSSETDVLEVESSEAVPVLHYDAADPFITVAEPVVTTPDVPADDHRLQIFVVDANPTARKLMSGKLEAEGYSVICPESGREAIEMALRVRPALILADIAMPGMDGYAVCRTLRDHEETSRIPVVLISGKGGYYEEDLGEAAGADGFITKPFGPETLMKTVETYLAAAAPNR